MGTQRSVFTPNDNPISRGISVAVGPDLANKNAQRAATYNAAAHEWNAGTGRSFNNFVNAMSPMGFSMEPPDIARPQTFSGSTYHLGWNPGSLMGLATGAVVPGSGLITGPMGQAAYTALGGKNPILTGPGKMGMPTWDAPGTGNPKNPMGAFTPGGGQLAGAAPAHLSGNTGNGGGMGAFPQQNAPGGAAFGAQPSQQAQVPTNTGNSMAAFFTPKIANHTLPQGYQSMFPNSLSAEDMALLYGKALA